MLSNVKNNLFTEVNFEESATVSGGQTTPGTPGTGTFNFNLNKYLFIVGAGVVYGNAGLTANELDFAFEQAILDP